MAISEAAVYITDDLQLTSYILYTVCARSSGVLVWEMNPEDREGGQRELEKNGAEIFSLQ